MDGDLVGPIDGDAEPTTRAARRALRGRRRRPVDLRLPRRDDPQHRRVRARLSQRATTVLLEQNYRSTQTILSAANAVIAPQPEPASQESLVGRRRGRAGRSATSRTTSTTRRRWVAGEIDRLADDEGVASGGRRGVLPHQRPVPGLRGGLHPGRPALPGGRWRAVLRTPRGARPPGLPAGDRQPDRRGQPAPDPQHPAPRHRRPGRRRASRRWPTASGSRSPRRSTGPTRRRASSPLAGGDRGLQPADDRAAWRSAGAAAARPTVIEAVLDRTGYLAELQESPDPQDEGRVDNLNELVAVARESRSASTIRSRPSADRDRRSDAGSRTDGRATASRTFLRAGLRWSPTPTRSPTRLVPTRAWSR